MPYSPSFVLDLTADVDERIKHVIDMVFLPGFNSPTIAVLFQNTQTWTRRVITPLRDGFILTCPFSRLREYKDTVGLIVFTLDLITRNCPVLTAIDGLPYDCLYLVPCSAELGGVIVVSANSLIHVDQTSRRVILPINGWQARVSDHPLPQLTEEEKQLNLKLEGSYAVFVDDKKLFLLLSDGTVYPVEVHADGRTVSRLTLSSALARTTIPSTVRRVADEHLFIGSIVGPSVLLKASRVEEEIKVLQDKIMEAGGEKLRSQRAKVDDLKEQINSHNEEMSNAEVSHPTP